MPHIKNNYDMFARRGDPWDAPEHARLPSRDITGRLRLPKEALIAGWKLRPIPLTKDNSSDIETHSLDLDSVLLASRALGFNTRLAKERNKILPPMSEGKSSTSDMAHKQGLLCDSRRAISTRYLLTQKRASHLIKVK